MTIARRALSGITAQTALIVTIALIISFLSGLGQSAGILPAPPGNDLYITNAAVTIKTQKAADSIKGGVRGIDVSKYNGTINWKKVAKADVEFVFVRSTYGTANDPMFVANAKAAHENGLKVGAYHFATFTTTAQMKKEANAFLKQLKKVDLTYPVVLDFEDEGGRYKSMKKATLTKLATGFMDIIKDAGYNVMLYSGYNFINSHLDKKKLASYDLWVANYLEQPKSIAHKIWQHTSYGSVSGISGRVDINIAYEDLSAGGSGASIKVNKTVSNSIKETLNARYDAGLSMSGLNMEKMGEAIALGLQAEINRQWGLNYSLDGRLDREQVNTLAEVTFTSSTKGNITYLLQAKLFYKGLYKGEPTASFDDNTVKAVKAFQKQRGLADDGILDAPTLFELLLY